MSIGRSGKRTTDQFFKVFKLSGFTLIKEFQILSVVFQDKLDAELHISFGTLHHIEHISKSKFWFDHPELSNVTTCVRIFSSKSGTEGVDVGKGTTEVFNSQLARDSQVSNFLEKLFSVVNFSFNLRNILNQARFRKNSGDLEHLSGTLAVCSCDERSMDVEETIVLEKLMC